MNFFMIPVFSFVPTKYRELVEEKGGKVFGALLVCFLILGIISGIRGTAAMNELSGAIKSDCPDFELRGGEFSIDDTYIFDEDNVYMEVDDSIDKVAAADVDALSSTGKYQSVVIVGKHSAGMYNNGQIQVIDYDKLGDFEISKDKIVNTFLPALNVVIIAACILGAFVAIGLYYLAALILQYITSAFSKGMFKNELTETERFRITVLATFPPHLLVYILKIPGLHIGFLVNIILRLGFIALVLYFYAKTAENDEISDTVIDA
ncbi:MAG: DUF1189 domain-containing protein [Lachnospiraceae bacterium]|nr:DUF1189 domain-containing protein [Lachnospiraceae bacterium]